MHPKIRSPLATWLLTIFTSGIYLFFWVWRVTSELNSAEGRQVFNIALWGKVLVALLILVFIGLIFAVRTNNPIPLIGPFLPWFGFFIYVQLSMGNYIKAKDKELNTGASFSNTVSIILLWMVANLGVAYMQSGINRIITCERKRSP